jgi:hypothetical protein
MKILKFRYSKTEKEHEYKEELVISTKKKNSLKAMLGGKRHNASTGMINRIYS